MNEDGPPPSVVSGATVSTVNVRVAGVGSTLPSRSIARTANVCGPSGSCPAERSGDVHGANAPASSLHSNVEPGFVELNVNIGVVSFVGPSGPCASVVSGASVSIVNVRRRRRRVDVARRVRRAHENV